MKIKNIKVTELFGLYNHEIDLSEGNITLVLGDNGIGKTTLFKMTYAFFTKDYDYLMAVDYKSMSIELEDGRLLTMTPIPDDAYDIDLQFEYKHDETSHKETLSVIKAKQADAAKQLKRYFPSYYRQLDNGDYIDLRTGSKKDQNQVRDDFFISIPSNVRNDMFYPLWLEQFISSVNISSIKAQRILTKIDDKKAKDDSEKYKNTLKMYSNDVVDRIEKAIAEANKKNTELDNSYTRRLVSNLQDYPNLASERLMDVNMRLKEVEDKQKMYAQMGLVSFDENNSVQLRTWLKRDKSTLFVVLNTYIDDMHKKLHEYDAIYQKLSLFVTLANCYLVDKEFKIDPKKGFIVDCRRRAEFSGYDLEYLSSGEQNILVLLYNLLFLTEKHSVLLIDEPEISFHVAWQRRFVDDMLKIIGLNPMQICIATHSPSLINNHWNLTQEITSLSENESKQE